MSDDGAPSTWGYSTRGVLDREKAKAAPVAAEPEGQGLDPDDEELANRAEDQAASSQSQRVDSRGKRRRPSHPQAVAAGAAPDKSARVSRERDEEKLAARVARTTELAFSDDPKEVVMVAARLVVGSEDPVAAVRVVAAFQHLLARMAATNAARGVYVSEVQRGSVWVKFRHGLMKLVRSEGAQLLADQTRQGLEANFIENAQSQNALNMAKGIAEVMNAAKGADTVAMDAGQFVLAKITDENGKEHWRARARSSREIAEDNFSDKQLENPHELFKMLDGQGG